MRRGHAEVFSPVIHEVLVGVVQHQPGARRRAQVAGPLHLLPAEKNACRIGNTDITELPNLQQRWCELWHQGTGFAARRSWLCSATVVNAGCAEVLPDYEDPLGRAPVGLLGFTNTTIRGGLGCCSWSSNQARSGCRLSGWHLPSTTFAAPPVICRKPSAVNNCRCGAALPRTRQRDQSRRGVFGRVPTQLVARCRSNVGQTALQATQMVRMAVYRSKGVPVSP